ncbi:MAG: aminotransferase class V-fold PLP-dependent enzyme, partial [Acidobacteriaceae bacterium]
MNTSDRDHSENLGKSGGIGAPSIGRLPDVAAITQLANEFFRALPGQPPSPLPMQPAVEMPVTPPAFETRLPQFGAPLPSIPAVPSADKLPNEANVQSQPDVPRPTRALPASEDAAMASIAAIPASGPGFSQYSARNMSVEQSLSPFSAPMPGFDTTLPSFEPSFPSFSVPPAFPGEDLAMATSQSPNSFYFLQDAGRLSKPLSTPISKHFATYEPDAVPDLKLVRQQFDVGSVRRDFPILHERVNGHPLVWLDNAATTQKPQSVIDRVSYFYEHENSNIHRAAHELAARATDAYEYARAKVAHFLNASSSKEIVFVRGATEAINLVAQGWGRRHISKDDEIVITWIEHHANIVPWQMLAAEKGARLRVAPVDEDGQILLDEFEKLLGPKTRFVSITQVSNALGT